MGAYNHGMIILINACNVMTVVGEFILGLEFIFVLFLVPCLNLF